MSYFFNNNDDYCKNLDTIKTLVELVSQNKLGKLEIKEGDLSIKIEGKPCPPPHHSVPLVAPASVDDSMPMQPQSNQTIIDSAVKVENSVPVGNVVKAPIVGTFYASPSPDKPPYVKVGDTVKKGDVIMIIESMKLMNEVQSDFDGVVKKILVENGSCVEYDQPIMIIE